MGNISSDQLEIKDNTNDERKSEQQERIRTITSQPPGTKA